VEDRVLAEIRVWTGSTPDDTDLGVRYTRLGSVEAVALEVLRERLAGMLAEPARYSIDGDASWSYEKNIEALRESIKGLATSVAQSSGTAGTLTVGRLVRAGATR
jgi:hypothetical protein